MKQAQAIMYKSPRGHWQVWIRCISKCPWRYHFAFHNSNKRLAEYYGRRAFGYVVQSEGNKHPLRMED